MSQMAFTRQGMARVRKAILAEGRHRCAFPGCSQDLMQNGICIGEVASIHSLTAEGARYDPTMSTADLMSPENFVLLCPNHHRVIDHDERKYNVQWLKEVKARHLERIDRALGGIDRTVGSAASLRGATSLEQALAIWKASRENASEEYWQKLFENCPAVISQMFPRHVIQYGKKAYVGGKSITNSGGSVVDFVYLNPATNNVVLVEIKTPKTRLLGKQYRQNAYAPGDEITGSIAQILNYRDSLVKEYNALSRSDPDSPFTAFSPKCVVIAGNIGAELDSTAKMRSFELFREELRSVELISYDELFDKVQGILDIVR